jgi:hypothetical protein
MPAKLAPGTYKLDATVVNPTPDRRSKYDWQKMPLWYSGMQFTVTVASTLTPSEVPADFDPAIFEFNLIRPTDGKYRGSAVDTLPVNKASAVSDALLPHLVPVNVDPVEIFLREHDTETVLRRLLASGKVTLADLNEVV